MPVEANPGTICTGDALVTPLVRYEFFASPNLWVLDAVYGFFSDYTYPDRFTECDVTTIDEAAQAFSAMLSSLRRSLLMIGAIIPYAGTLPTDPSILPCDGASYLRVDYPDLFSAIGTVYGSVDSSHFNVPDLRGRSILGVGSGSGLSTYSLGDTGGEESHILVTGEIPSHTHTDTGHTHVEGVAAPAAGAAIAGVPIPSAVPAAGVTNSGTANLTSTGGDGAHENRQPYMALNYAIIAF